MRKATWSRSFQIKTDCVVASISASWRTKTIEIYLLAYTIL